MRVSRWLRIGVWGLLSTVTACTTTDVVYRDRAPFNTAADTTSGLLGYYTVSAKQTTCGNCHVDYQARWSQTHHSNAWSDLIASGHATASCYGCHTVNEAGNGLAGPAGYNKTPDSTYHDVQCESCHGPGSKHVANPDNTHTIPLAHVTLYDSAASCAACHTGVHEPFTQEWEMSGHAQLVTAAVNNTSGTCKSCHEGKGVLVAWGVNSNYVERDSAGNSPITCAVCHDPHGSPNAHQLRFPIDNPDPEQNLCMKCHLNRGQPVAGAHGVTPHAPQGFVLLGTAGYRPAGVAIDTLIALTTHASIANPRLCAGCHVNAYDVTDATTGAFVFHSTGHSFRPIPCVDANGQPTSDTTCAYTPAARTFASCTAAGCHGSQAVAASLLAQVRSDIATLADQIWIDANHNGIIDAYPADSGYLALVQRDHPADLSNATTVTPAQGAEFNVDLFGEGRYANGDKSHGVHNPFLARALLAADITELQKVYGYASPSGRVQSVIAKAFAEARQQAPGFITAKP